MRRLGRLPVIVVATLLSALPAHRSRAQVAPGQPAQPPGQQPQLSGPEALRAETDQILADRNLRQPVYDGVKFLALAAQGRLNQADAVFVTRGATRQSLQNGRVLETLRRLNLKPPFSVQCVGANEISGQAFTMVYVATTEDGPIGVKLYVYRHEKGTFVGRIDVTEDWTELEQMADSVLRLPTPVVINAREAREGETAPPAK